MKKQSGITLIALVITIIVLLILAGVSISLVVGNNGVLTQASSAVIANKEATAREDVVMAWSSAITKYWGDWANDATVNKDNYLTKAELDQYLPNGSLVEDPTFADGVYTVKYQKDGEVYTYTIDGSGNATAVGTSTPLLLAPETPITASDIAAAPATYYNKTVAYTANEFTDWKIFYADDNNIFLILADYLPRAKAPAGTGIQTDDSYSLWGNSVPAAQTVTSSLKSSFKWDLWTNYSSKNNGKCVSTLLNTNNWTAFVNPAYADYAIGSPTAEMFFASWNDLYPEDRLSCNNVDSNGYLVGVGDDVNYGGFAAEGMKARRGYSNTLFYPHPQNVEHDETLGDYVSGEYGYAIYYLASPGSTDRVYILGVSSVGYLGAIGYTSLATTVRPVVRLKTGIELVTDTNGGCDYKISE